MAYLGRGLDKISNIEVLDNITFDGSSSYSITKGSVAFTPNSAQSLLISIDGVVQATNFTVNTSTIDFGVAIPSTSTCNFFLHYGTGVMTVPSDGSVTTAKLGDSAVTTAKIVDGAVTSAKLASGVGGSLILLSQASSTTAISQIDLTASSDYDDYILNMTAVPETDNASIFCRVFVGGTIQTSSNYAYGSIRTDGTAFGNSGNANSDTEIQLHNQYGAGNQTDEGISFNMNMININSTIQAKDFFYNVVMDNQSNNHLGHIGNGRYNSNANVVSGFRLFMSSGNITRYDYRFYGVKK